MRVVVGGAERRWQITRSSREELLVELKRLQRVGKVASGKGTFGEWLDAWLEESKSANRAKTYESYEAVVRLRLKPVCGGRRLAKLEPHHIAAAVAAAKKAGLSTGTQAYVRTVARIALEVALKRGKVMRNVAKDAPAVRVERKEIHPFSDEEFAALLKVIAGDRLEAAYLLTLAIGPRKGEILGLQWRDVIEHEGKTLVRIARQVQRVDGKLHVSPVKTDRGRRTVDLPPEVADALKRHRVRQLEERMKAGNRWKETGHVFTTLIGTPIDPRNLLADFYAKQERAGIFNSKDAATKKNRRSFHALRHDAATAALVAGTDLKEISINLGHSSERFTHDQYTHLVPAISGRMQEAASARLRKK